MTKDKYKVKKKQWPAWKVRDIVAQYLLFGCALLACLSLLLIIIYLFVQGMPAIKKIGLLDFVFGSRWNPSNNQYGIGAMLITTLLSSFGAIVISSAVGVLTAVFMTEVATSRTANFIRPAIELLAGIPSVVYGFFGLVTIVPLIDSVAGGGGNSLLAVVIILAIMILPTIVSISEVSLRSVPQEYKEGSLALGATKMQTVFKVVVPAAQSGIMAGIVLGIGRAVGETMAVILVAGNAPIIPHSLFDRVRTMTANIALEMGYAFGLQQEALFATGLILFVFIMALNLIFTALVTRMEIEA